MTNEEMRKQIENVAKSYEAEGYDCYIGTMALFIVIDDGKGNQVFFAQDEDAGKLLDEAEEAAEKFGVDKKDYLYYILNNAGAL